MELQEPLVSNPLTNSEFSLYFHLDSNNFQYDEISSDELTLDEDLWGFGFFWPEIRRNFSSTEELYAAIQDLFDMIAKIKEENRGKIEEYPPLEIIRNEDRGICGSYYLIDDTGKRHYIIKPLDEDAGCIHSDGFASPFLTSPFRANMPLYFSAMREVLAYEVAKAIGVGSIVPKTTLGIFSSDLFSDFCNQIDSNEIKTYLEQCNFADKEKLCSVQEYVEGAKSLFEAIHDLEMAELTDDEIAKRFDQTDFEDANILIWVTYDTDAHMGNFLVYPKGTDEIGNEILGLKKIDNGLTFPDKNQQLRNNLSYLPNAGQPLSQSAKEKIEAIDIDTLAEQLEQMGLNSAVSALKTRISLLKSLAKIEGITIKQINKAMSMVGKKS
ncbi:MAG: hypothetical protein COT85_02125 [Chlamydiae bacterium CG10_big_fil_rev_8_21_14_0_10_42_34]|nr:MAG: hypothetical protein COT85_02125 [Chlamydiae bacterium CG10_big_fil_rev_8_21_14_0_10_42_34]